MGRHRHFPTTPWRITNAIRLLMCNAIETPLEWTIPDSLAFANYDDLPGTLPLDHWLQFRLW